MSRTIRAGGLLIKDPDSSELFTMDWDTEHLRPGVQISTQQFFITGPDSVLTKDSESILAGLRMIQLRLLAGTLGAKYTVTSRIVTNENPPQTKDASFKVLIQSR